MQFQNDADDVFIKLDNASTDGVKLGIGQKAMSASLPVVIASDQNLIATSANQATANASLAAIDAGIPVTLGQTTKINSMPVVPPSDFQQPVINMIVNPPIYEDMNALVGGVARGTNITTSYVNLYSYTGSGMFYGTRITYQTLNLMQVRIVIDGVDYLMGTTGLSLADLSAGGLYNYTTNLIRLGLGFEGNTFTFEPVAPLRFTTSLLIKTAVISGASKQFLAGLAVRSL